MLSIQNIARQEKKEENIPFFKEKVHYHTDIREKLEELKEEMDKVFKELY